MAAAKEQVKESGEETSCAEGVGPHGSAKDLPPEVPDVPDVLEPDEPLKPPREAGLCSS